MTFGIPFRIWLIKAHPKLGAKKFVNQALAKARKELAYFSPTFKNL
jgi:hypothetical protein